MGRVRVRKICDLDDREILHSEIGKGYEYAKDQIVAISDEELRELPLPTAKAIEIQAFMPLESIDPIRLAEGYCLVSDGQVAAKLYKLLRQALDRSSKAPPSPEARQACTSAVVPGTGRAAAITRRVSASTMTFTFAENR